jgi:light-regulated signal transduction histidine kinase (bacteriophytochrome)
MLNIVSDSAYKVDMTNCDQEPIHIPSFIQQSGVLMVLKEPELEIVQISDNVNRYFKSALPESLIGESVNVLLKGPDFEALKASLSNKNINNNPIFLLEIAADSGNPEVSLNIIAHRINGVLVIEMEATSTSSQKNGENLIHTLKEALNRIKASQDIEQFWQNVIQEIKILTGFDRVMVYEFGQGGSGSVIAEVKEDYLEPYLGLHYPASDIPSQARELYMKNKLRVIPDINYQPAKMLKLMSAETDQPLDMTYALLRGVSPIHVQYLQNMGVSATMTLSILEGDSLCGMIACHHYTPKQVPYDIRICCMILGQFINLEYLARVAEKEYRYQLKLLEMESRFVEFVSKSESIAEGLMNFSPNLGDFINAEGAIMYEGSVIYTEGSIKMIGLTPPQNQIHNLISWLKSENKKTIYCTDELTRVFPPALEYKHLAAGMLAITISADRSSYVLWFRPEVIQTVNWAGDPSKSDFYRDEQTPLTPRASFALWKETIRHKSLPWSPHEQLAAAKLREVILRLSLYKEEALLARNQELEKQILQKTEDLAKSNAALEKFTLMASYDLQAPLRKVSQFSRFLKNVSPTELSEENAHYIDRIQITVQKMQTLIDNLLDLSRINQTTEALAIVDLRDIILTAIRELEPVMHASDAIIKVEETFPVECYPQKIQLLFKKILENSLKFQKANNKPVVDINVKALDENTCEITIHDNGIGFDEKYLDRIFKTFETLHGASAYEGSGIGLGIVLKVVEIHHGTVTARSVPDEGSTFIVRLPITQKTISSNP